MPPTTTLSEHKEKRCLGHVFASPLGQYISLYRLEMVELFRLDLTSFLVRRVLTLERRALRGWDKSYVASLCEDCSSHTARPIVFDLLAPASVKN